MIAEGCDDCEGDLLERVRAIVGPRVVIGAELDRLVLSAGVPAAARQAMPARLASSGRCG